MKPNKIVDVISVVVAECKEYGVVLSKLEAYRPCLDKEHIAYIFKVIDFKNVDCVFDLSYTLQTVKVGVQPCEYKVIKEFDNKDAVLNFLTNFKTSNIQVLDYSDNYTSFIEDIKDFNELEVPTLFDLVVDTREKNRECEKELDKLYNLKRTYEATLRMTLADALVESIAPMLSESANFSKGFKYAPSECGDCIYKEVGEDYIKWLKLDYEEYMKDMKEEV